MSQRHKARAARRAARRLAKAAVAGPLPTPVQPDDEPAGAAAAEPGTPVAAAGVEPTDDAEAAWFRLTEIVYVRDDQKRGPFSDAAVIGRGLPGGGVAVGNTSEDGIVWGAPASRPGGIAPIGSDFRDPPPPPLPHGRTPGDGASGRHADPVGRHPGQAGSGGPADPYVDTYLNLGTEWDYCWIGPAMGRRKDGPSRSGPTGPG